MIARVRIVTKALSCAFRLLALTGAGIASQAGPNASLIVVPVNGTAPLTVDFAVGVANPQGPMTFQWKFGDGAASAMQSGAYMIHVYQHPGTYLCSLTMTTAQGRSATLFTTIIVKPRRS